MKQISELSILFISTFLIFSCQSMSTNPEPSKTTTIDASQNKNRHELIKEEKRKQSEADLPFRGLDTSKKITSVVFGSSMDQDQPQPLWSAIAAVNPDLFVYVGEQNRKLNKIPDYRNIREKVPFLAIWNDQGAPLAVADNESSRAEFSKYWTYIRTTLPKNQKALYHSKIIGSKKQTLQVILLDTRSDRSELKINPDDQKEIRTPIIVVPTSADSTTNATLTTPTNETKALIVQQPKPFLADDDKNKHFLSDEQWNWLENELRKPATFRLLVSPIQVIANDHQFEKWGNFPRERERLLNLLKSTKAKNLLILSSHRNSASIAQTDIKGLGKIYDATTSSINQPGKPSWLLKDSTYLTDAYPDVNFGLVKIDWENRKAKVEIHGLENKVVNSTEVNF